MVKVYQNGSEFLEENKEYLDTNKYMSIFFYIDSEFLNITDKDNYAIRVSNNLDTLLAMKLKPYNLLLFGSNKCLKELLIYLNDNDYSIGGVLSSVEIGDYLVSISKGLINESYEMEIGMDFMEARDILEKTSRDVEVANINDSSTIKEYMEKFYVECGLDPSEAPSLEKVESHIGDYRLIRVNNEIVSIARKSKATDEAIKISAVYTKKDKRGMGYARKVVNALKNEILEEGKIAVLNVDKKNPISNHIYSSLGFKKIFSQGVYKITR